MALPILDGNQSATTLSTILTGGQHIPAHTVVSLGSQAITDMRGAVSGSVVSISNFPASQTISGTVTASQFFTVVTSATINFATTVTSTEAFDTTDDHDFVVIQTDLNNSGELGTVYIDRYTTPTASGGSSNFALWDDKNKELFNAGGGNDLCTTKNQKSIYYSTGFASRFYYRFRTADNAGGISGSAKLYAIKSDYPTERTNNDAFGVGKIPVAGDFYLTNSSVTANIGNSVTIGSLPAISGTVTANLDPNSSVISSQIESGIGSYAADLANDPFPISGTVTANAGTEMGTTGNNYGIIALGVDDTGTANPLKLDGNTNLAISGTVTANNPSGALTTRFGSVTTANTAQLTSAVTNTSRKYLLVQNIATSTVTIGIGFAPTTTQGIQLTAGAGLTFDAFCPTGGVWWLSSTTGSNFSILEG